MSVRWSKQELLIVLVLALEIGGNAAIATRLDPAVALRCE
jgi:hypothetical protein